MVEELKTAILKHLVTDFASRQLTLSDLSDGYVGVNVVELTQRCCDTVVGASSVDFDVALKDLEDGHLVNTGPMDVSRVPGIIAVFSTREYAFLTEKGYKAAKNTMSKKTPSTRPPMSTFQAVIFINPRLESEAT